MENLLISIFCSVFIDVNTNYEACKAAGQATSAYTGFRQQSRGLEKSAGKKIQKLVGQEAVIITSVLYTLEIKKGAVYNIKNAGIFNTLTVGYINGEYRLGFVYTF